MVIGTHADSVHRSAFLSPCGTYRYTLSRWWTSEHDHPLVVIGLNPSTADGEKDDPTIRRCMGFAKAWGHTGLIMVNLFAWRATSPKDMKRAAKDGRDVIGLHHNDQHLVSACSPRGRTVLCAWGLHGTLQDRGRAVWRLLRGYTPEAKLVHFGLTENGQPLHPLFMPKDMAPIPYAPKDG